MEDHSDTESSTQILGCWDFPPPVNHQGLGTNMERGSTSTMGGGRVLPPWTDPSYEWGGGKLKQDGRKNKMKNKDMIKKKKKDSDNSDLSREDLMDEYSSLPPQIAEWFWCIEYVAKFVKDIRCMHEIMNMGYPCKYDFGRRINEILSLRILEFLFDPTKNDATVVDLTEPRVEFNLSLSNTHVLSAILKDIPVLELQPGMPELSKFNVLPFIAHKNMSLPPCALEKLRDLDALENQTSAAPSMEANDPVFRDDQSERDEMAVDEQQAHTVLEQTNINDKDKVIDIDNADDPMQTSETDEVIVIDDNETTAEPVNNGDTCSETLSASLDVRVKCTDDGIWLISESDEESDKVKGPALARKNANENVCWRCKRGGTLLVCSRNDCAAKVHKECLNCPANFDEDKNFYCPVCWYDRTAREYHKSQKLLSGAKKRLVKFLPLLSRAGKRLR